jgi:hypothetical protein
MQNMDRKSILVILGILAVVVIGSFLMSRGGQAEENQIGEQDTRPNLADEDNRLGGVALGRVVVTENVDRDSCPVSSISTLDANLSRFYVVAQNSTFPAGADFFVRLYRDGIAVEDSPLVAAEENYEGICIYAVFEAARGAFERGNYEAEFIINGNPSETVAFTIR